jgi:hypothetical protein
MAKESNSFDLTGDRSLDDVDEMEDEDDDDDPINGLGSADTGDMDLSCIRRLPTRMTQ